MQHHSMTSRTKKLPTIMSISCLQICKSCMLLTEILLRACRFPLGTLTRNTSENPPKNRHKTKLVINQVKQTDSLL